MIYYKYSPEQLEHEAENLLRSFDESYLKKPKPLDVYAVIEKCLDVPYDWKYLTPDQSVLGCTAFNAGCIWVLEKPYYTEGDRPYQIYLEKGTIVIDSTLTESNNRGRENFTVLHEVFHQVIHRACFRRIPADYIHGTTNMAINGKKALITPLDIIEYQANTCAAAFLMPRNVVKQVFLDFAKPKELSAGSHKGKQIIKTMAPEFNASEMAMTYRLQKLGLLR